MTMLFSHTHMQKSNAASQPNSTKRSFSIFGGTTLIGNVLWNLCIHSNHHPMIAKNLCESPSQKWKGQSAGKPYRFHGKIMVSTGTWMWVELPPQLGHGPRALLRQWEVGNV